MAFGWEGIEYIHLVFNLCCKVSSHLVPILSSFSPSTSMTLTGELEPNPGQKFYEILWQQILSGSQERLRCKVLTCSDHLPDAVVKCR